MSVWFDLTRVILLSVCHVAAAVVVFSFVQSQLLVHRRLFEPELQSLEHTAFVCRVYLSVAKIYFGC